MKKLICLLLLIPFLFLSCNKEEEPKIEYEGTYKNIEGYFVTNKSTGVFVYPITSTCQIKGNTIILKASTNSKSLFEKSITFTENRNYSASIGFYEGSKYIGSFTPSNKQITIFIDNQDTYLGYKVDFSCIYK